MFLNAKRIVRLLLRVFILHYAYIHSAVLFIINVIYTNIFDLLTLV